MTQNEGSRFEGRPIIGWLLLFIPFLDHGIPRHWRLAGLAPWGGYYDPCVLRTTLSVVFDGVSFVYCFRSYVWMVVVMVVGRGWLGSQGILWWSRVRRLFAGGERCDGSRPSPICTDKKKQRMVTVMLVMKLGVDLLVSLG